MVIRKLAIEERGNIPLCERLIGLSPILLLEWRPKLEKINGSRDVMVLLELCRCGGTKNTQKKSFIPKPSVWEKAVN